MNLTRLSLVQAANLIRSGDLSPVDYVHALFDGMDQVEPRVQAWVTIDRDAVMSEAKACEVEAREKRFRGPLHGIPVGVKDIFYTKGMRTSMGTALFADFVPEEDAGAVAKLKQAGAIIMGKTATTVFAYLDPGATRNPWNLDHTPGGSSSGSAAAVAARMCPAAIGTQTVGSVSRPAAFNGLVSIVPSQQRIQRDGVFPLAPSLDHVGAFARSVADVELMLKALSESPIERASVDRAFRIGVIRESFYENAAPEARSLYDAFAAKLAAAGFEVSEVRLPTAFGLVPSVLPTILRFEAASVHERLFAENAEAYSPKLREVIEAGLLIKVAEYQHARRLREQYQQDMLGLFADFDVVMTPAAPGPAPESIASTGNAVMNAPWTLADFPTVTVPHALTDNGLPIAVQLSAPPLQEGLLLAAAQRVEQVAQFHAQPE